MIKVIVKAKDGAKVTDLTHELTAWCVEHIGPAVPRGHHNQKKRKLWKVKAGGFFDHSVHVFVRNPEHHTMLALRWM
jgi:hypothetical protein